MPEREYSQRSLELARYRIEKARSALEDARTLFAQTSYRGSNNRAYYAVFDGLRALLALEGVDYRKHSGVISHFQMHYVKTGVFSSELSRIVTSASLVRNASDYEDFFVASRQEAQAQIEGAAQLLDAIGAFILKASS
ncbi:MAG: HEPN domain-containing protein [Coriobacteriia bacterium]|nr:HEPN domain-containing protein [Coriobacteriia bacterium]